MCKLSTCAVVVLLLLLAGVAASAAAASALATTSAELGRALRDATVSDIVVPARQQVLRQILCVVAPAWLPARLQRVSWC